ncbi:DNA-binding response regulator [Floricoccus penangensis]|uniref:DNA-binding response regulator n=1 Tax=Floricoccus penangensis TaxID=1859475 RepID=A0A9Q5JF27_9LACT|nr:response regulator transcription factor [Floricoccus penangensis]OFI46168.1 DNA-binding response regulator [Floricoccus penangensis]
MKKIFIVEDDESIVNSLKTALSQEFSVASVQNFRSVSQEISEFEPDLVLMDITLPYFNGFYWTTEVRKKSKVPIIFISSATDEMNAIMAMNMGADDFISKPFSLEILKAKINALLRRTSDFSNSSLQFGDFSLSFDGQVTGTNGNVHLTATENRIIRALFEQAGTVLTKEALLAKLWEGDDFFDANALQVNIARLRKKLAEIGFEHIHTVRGVGYVLK